MILRVVPNSAAFVTAVLAAAEVQDRRLADALTDHQRAIANILTRRHGMSEREALSVAAHTKAAP